MTRSQLSRLSGMGLWVGAVTFIVHIGLRSVITAGPDPAAVVREGLWVPINALGLLGAALVLLGLPAMCARIAALAGLPGLLGTVLIAVAWMFWGVFLSFYSVLVVPWLAEKAPALVAASAPLPTGFLITFIAGLIAWLVGTVLLAIPFLRGRVQPRWIGYLLPASGLWLVVGNLLLAPGGPATNLAINLLSNLGPVLLLAGLGFLGWRMWTERAPAD